MRNYLSILLLIVTSFGVAQEVYDVKSSIKYYPEVEYVNDTYKSEQCVLDIYYPKSIKNFGTIIWFHGGGLTSGYKEIPEYLKNKGYCIIGVEYRLSPKVKAPLYIEDCAAAIAWTFNNIKNYGGDNSKIFLSGHSAGGYLILMAVLDKKYLNRYNIDADRIAGIIAFSPQCITHFTIRDENGIPALQPTIDQYAPIYHVRKDCPPILLITGDREMELLGRYEENAYFGRMMLLNGHKETKLYEIGGYGHDMVGPGYPLLLNEVKRILKKQL